MAENAAKTDIKTQGVKRNDPDPRPTDGAINRVAVTGKDPNKHYVWVSEANDPTMNPGSYRAMGYDFTQYDKDEVQPILGYQELNQGDRVRGFGCILMECSLEQKAKIDQEGVPGMGQGQNWAEKIVDTIRKRDVIDETEPMSKVERAKMRGIMTGRRYAQDDRNEWGF